MAPKKDKKADAAEEDKIARPDKAAFDEKTKGISEQIEKLQRELKEVSSQIQGKGAGKDEFFKQKSDIREKINAETQAMNELHARKDEIQAKKKEGSDAQRAAQTEMNNLRKELQYKTTDEIEQRIAHNENRMMHESITLKEEKKLMEENKSLRKMKPKVSQMYIKEAQFKGSIDAAKAGNENTKEELDLLFAEIKQHKEVRDRLYEDLKKLQEERDAATGDVGGLFEQREKLNEQIRGLIAKRNELRDEYKAAENKYYEWQREQRQARQEKAAAERVAWQEEKKKADRQRKVDNLDNQPFTAEIALIEQTQKFCKGFLPKEDKVVEEKKEIQHDNPDTHMVLASKKDREDEFYFAPTKKTKGAKAKKGGAKESNAKVITHKAENYKLFWDVGLDAPKTTDDIPATLEALDAKMKYYQEKIKEWEVSREEKKRRILAGEESDEEPAAEAKEETPAAEEGADPE